MVLRDVSSESSTIVVDIVIENEAAEAGRLARAMPQGAGDDTGSGKVNVLGDVAGQLVLVGAQVLVTSWGVVESVVVGLEQRLKLVEGGLEINLALALGHASILFLMPASFNHVWAAAEELSSGAKRA